MLLAEATAKVQDAHDAQSDGCSGMFYDKSGEALLAAFAQRLEDEPSEVLSSCFPLVLLFNAVVLQEGEIIDSTLHLNQVSFCTETLTLTYPFTRLSFLF